MSHRSIMRTSLIIGTLAGGAAGALAQSNYDGVYRGLTVPVETNETAAAPFCWGNAYMTTLQIANGAFRFTYNRRNEYVTGQVQANGKLLGSGDSLGGGVTLSGRIEGGDLTGKLRSHLCAYVLQLSRVQ